MADGLIGGRPCGTAIHATAVTIAGRALLVFGPSGSGKSRLALALIAASTRPRPIRLVGDDRILLTYRGGRIVARPHPRIAGFIERRGLGILATPFVGAAPVGGWVELGRTTLPAMLVQNFPGLPCVILDEASGAESRRDAVLGWWRDACTTPGPKATVDAAGGAKD